MYVVNGTVARIRGIDSDGEWVEDDRGYVDAPVTGPLSPEQVARRLPTLSLGVGDFRPHVRGRIREYLLL